MEWQHHKFHTSFAGQFISSPRSGPQPVYSINLTTWHVDAAAGSRRQIFISWKETANESSTRKTACLPSHLSNYIRKHKKQEIGRREERKRERERERGGIRQNSMRQNTCMFPDDLFIVLSSYSHVRVRWRMCVFAVLVLFVRLLP